MRGIIANLLGATQLHQFAQIHDADPMAHMLDRCQVVADQNKGNTPLILDVLEQIKHLRPNGDIKIGYRLVENDERGFQR